jgi:hypothetical protein
VAVLCCGLATKVKASKARQAQSRLKAIEKMDIVDAVIASRALQFSFPEPEEMPTPLLALRGGGARKKWRRKQNQNRAAGGGYAGGGRARDRAGGGKRSGGADGAGGGAASFQTRWQNFARSGGGRQPRGAASEESVMSSQDVDSEGNEFVYVDGSDSGMDMGDSDEYIYVDEVCAVCAACGCAASASSANAAVTSYVLVSCHHTALQSR